MKVIKRNGTEVDFDSNKIYCAVSKANKNDVTDIDRMPDEKIHELTNKITERISKINRTLNVEEIQDMVENEIINFGYINLSKEYIKYRYKRALLRQNNTTDDNILTLIEGENEDIKEENSNKNPMIVSVQRDYMAGEVSKDLTRRVFLPKEITEAHDKGIIHFHKSLSWKF